MEGRHHYKMGLIGNCSTLAYIDQAASIDWLCLPRFDSNAVFNRLVDQENGGRFAVVPESPNFKASQAYLENTNILVTTFECSNGSFKVIDFCPRFIQFDRSFKPLNLMRKIEVTSGRPAIKIIFDPRLEYGRKTPVRFQGSNHLAYDGFDAKLRLTTNFPLNYISSAKVFALNKPLYFCMTYGAPLEAPLEETIELFLKKTIDYWQKWVAHSSIPAVFQKEVIRSALVLKLHQYEDTGAIIAAGSTSLPESPGSKRNWDYRYCWVRDSYYTLNAHRLIGHFEELQQFAAYIENLVLHGGDRLQPVYKIDGEADIEEAVIELPGYLGNDPVRIGNAAYKQIQNDVYGQALITLYPLYTDLRFVQQRRFISHRLIETLLAKIEQYFDEPDAGLWEFRHLTAKHTYTYLFHWVGAKAAMGIAAISKNQSLYEKAKKIAKKSATMIEDCYDHKRKVYQSAIDCPELDASLLNMITLGYLDPKAEKTHLHLKAMESKLKASDGLFYRYIHDDGFGKPEVTFGVCGTWYIEALAKSGRVEDAIRNFEAFLGYGNHLDLFSEDIDPNTGSQWGNFPQIFTHIGIIHCAHAISQNLGKPQFLLSEEEGAFWRDSVART